MNKKGMPEEIEFLFWIIGVCMVVFGFLYFATNWYDDDCADNYAKKVCEERNMTFDHSILSFVDNRIYCDLFEDERETKRETKSLKFIESEIDDCRSKNAWSFRRIKNE